MASVLLILLSSDDAQLMIRKRFTKPARQGVLVRKAQPKIKDGTGSAKR